jgi:hypothetical protein
MEKKPAIEYLQEELDKTIVLSDEFKTRLFTIASTVAEDAYSRGKRDGIKIGKKENKLDQKQIEDLKNAFSLTSDFCSIKRCCKCGGLYAEGWTSPYCDCDDRSEQEDDNYYFELW